MHISVLTTELIENLGIKAEGTYVDLTLGAGGHSLAILSQLRGGTLIAFDVDGNSTSAFEKVAAAHKGDNQIHLFQQNFETLAAALKQIQIEHVDGIIADLGWSSDQLETIPGLSHSQDTELDMRLDKNLGVSAKDLVNALFVKELTDLFIENADIGWNLAKQLAMAIVQTRKHKPISTTQDLLQIINALSVASHRGSRAIRHADNMPARVFQALRIVVNNELSTLQSVLPQAWNALRPAGTLQVITFHSGEDRIVKKQFKTWLAADKAQNLYAQEFILPSVAELTANLRARSAKLRGIKKI